MQWSSKWSNAGLIYFAEHQNEDVVYLTIDDFPSKDSKLSDRLLNNLKRNGVKVTFFVMQHNLKHDLNNEMVFEKLLKQGHELGNHYDIDRRADDLDEREFEQYLLGTEKWILQFDPDFNEKVPKFFRPPSGKSSEAMKNVLERHDYLNILGDVYSLDANYDKAPEKHADLIVKNIQKGSIIILHTPEEDKRQKTYKILDLIIPRIKAKGFRFELLSQYFRDENIMEKMEL
jgi:peptidoglycan/xylan/chitin deacetylase (PgdA/CDA1 family)